MAQLVGLGRLGRDAELRHTRNGDPVASLSLAFAYGRKDQGGKRPAQWVDASLWGQRAEALAAHLQRGMLLYVVLEDVHIQEFQRQDGTTSSKLVGRVASLEFAGSPGQQNQQQTQQARAPQSAPQRPRQRPQQNPYQQASSGGGMADMDDDIPFSALLPRHGYCI